MTEEGVGNRAEAEAKAKVVNSQFVALSGRGTRDWGLGTRGFALREELGTWN